MSYKIENADKLKFKHIRSKIFTKIFTHLNKNKKKKEREKPRAFGVPAAVNYTFPRTYFYFNKTSKNFLLSVYNLSVPLTWGQEKISGSPMTTKD